MDFKAMLSLKIGLKRNLERLSITTPYFITASEIKQKWRHSPGINSRYIIEYDGKGNEVNKG